MAAEITMVSSVQQTKGSTDRGTVTVSAVKCNFLFDAVNYRMMSGKNSGFANPASEDFFFRLRGKASVRVLICGGPSAEVGTDRHVGSLPLRLPPRPVDDLW